MQFSLYPLTHQLSWLMWSTRLIGDIDLEMIQMISSSGDYSNFSEGCFGGINSSSFTAAYPDIWWYTLQGVDLSPYFLAVAQHLEKKNAANGALNSKQIRYLHANAEETGLTSVSFDIVSCAFLVSWRLEPPSSCFFAFEKFSWGSTLWVGWHGKLSTTKLEKRVYLWPFVQAHHVIHLRRRFIAELVQILHPVCPKESDTRAWAKRETCCHKELEKYMTSGQTPNQAIADLVKQAKVEIYLMNFGAVIFILVCQRFIYFFSVVQFHEFPQQAIFNALREARRLLRPGGTITLIDTSVFPIFKLLDVAWWLQDRAMGRQAMMMISLV